MSRPPALLMLLCACAAPKPAADAALHLELAAPAGTSRAEHARAVAEAERIVDGFASTNGLVRRGPFFESVAVFASQAELWHHVRAVAKLPADAPLPTDGFAAIIEGGVLMAVTADEYARLRPEYAGEPDAWTRLLAHEMAHQLHVQLLGGDGDAMGPVWFYEGFALLAAGQRLGGETDFDSATRALAAAREAKGRGSYAVYASAVRLFASRAPVRELVDRAGKPGFDAWLEGLR